MLYSTSGPDSRVGKKVEPKKSWPVVIHTWIIALKGIRIKALKKDYRTNLKDVLAETWSSIGFKGSV